MLIFHRMKAFQTWIRLWVKVESYQGFVEVDEQSLFLIFNAILGKQLHENQNLLKKSIIS